MVTKREKPAASGRATRTLSGSHGSGGDRPRKMRRRKDETYLAFLVRLGDSLPEETVARLPADGSEELDHYIYGTPKRAT